MSTLVTDLNTLKTARDNMQNAFANKGVIVTKDIRTYANAIANIPSGSGSGDVKLFDTVEHMQADPNPSVGDLAVVYREEIQPVTEESEFDSCTFPQTVVLKEAFTGNIYGRFRAVDSSSGYFDGNIDMSSSSFRFEGWGESSQVRVEYTSQDGITYTRTDGGEELQEFGTTIKYEPMEPWNDVIGNFMKIGSKAFDGLFEYSNTSEKTYDLGMYPITDDYKFVNFIGHNIKASNLERLYNAINDIGYATRGIAIFKIGVGYCLLCTNDNMNIGGRIWKDPDTNNYHLLFESQNSSFSSSYSDYTVRMYDINIDEGSLGNYQEYALNKYVGTYTPSITLYFSTCTEIALDSAPIFISSDGNILDGSLCLYISSTNIKVLYNTAYNIDYVKSYQYALTQLSATSDYVYGKTFYGKNGVETGTLGNMLSNVFNDNPAEIYAKAQTVYDTMTPLIASNDNKLAGLGYDIVVIPSKSNGTPLLDTSNVTNMYDMFSGCTNLITIPLLDTSNVTNMGDMFCGCTNLITIPLLDTSNVTLTYRMFVGCTNLISIPLIDISKSTSTHTMFCQCSSLVTVPQLDTGNSTSMSDMFQTCSSLVTIPQLDTSNVTNMNRMFYLCGLLEDIPILNTSKVTDMGQMFSNCTSLSDESLNNILVMCANSSVPSNKTLKQIGLTSEQANICKTLSNYSAFTSAGWTTGY